MPTTLLLNVSRTTDGLRRLRERGKKEWDSRSTSKVSSSISREAELGSKISSLQCSGSPCIPIAASGSLDPVGEVGVSFARVGVHDLTTNIASGPKLVLVVVEFGCASGMAPR